MLTKDERDILIEMVYDPNVNTVDIGENKDFTHIWIHMNPNADHEEYINKMIDVFPELKLDSREPLEEYGYMTTSYQGTIYNENNEVYIYLFFKDDIVSEEAI